jgi:cytochrome P450
LVSFFCFILFGVTLFVYSPYRPIIFYLFIPLNVPFFNIVNNLSLLSSCNSTWHLIRIGPIVRIGPNELHILDADFYEQLYSQANKLDKYDYFYSMLGNPEATFPTIKADVHRRRRGALNPFFSTTAIARIEPTIHALAKRLADRMAACAARDEVIPLFYAYRCLTVDLISEYAFGKQLGMLDRADWGASFYSAWRALWEMSGLIRQLPAIMAVFQSLPRWVLACVNPRALEVIDMQIATDAQMKAILAADPETFKDRPFPTIMWEVAHHPTLLAEEKTFKRLAVEANNILAAGFETTGNVLTLITYLTLKHPDIHERLKKELADAIPNPDDIPSWQVLEKLPLLSGVVKESLR